MTYHYKNIYVNPYFGNVASPSNVHINPNFVPPKTEKISSWRVFEATAHNYPTQTGQFRKVNTWTSSKLNSNKFKWSRQGQSPVKKPDNPFNWKKQELSLKSRKSRDKFTINNNYAVKSEKLFKKSRFKIDKRSDETNRLSELKIKKFIEKNKSKKLINVRGEKFVTCANGKTLKRLNKSVEISAKRGVDLGGGSIKSTNSLIIMKNTLKSRNRLTNAKQRSIAILTKNNLKKVNIPCNIFRRLGRCLKHERGLCKYIHDTKQVDLCKKFLQGLCDDKNCLLSHEVVSEKIETCAYFLKGCCSRENCPYLHVKLSKKADICLDFLKGYCDKGEECLLRHLNICPDFEKSGYCKKGSQCPYRHEKKERKLKRKAAKKFVAVEAVEPEEDRRYYCNEKLLNYQEEVISPICPQRVKVDSLPSFISLERD